MKSDDVVHSFDKILIDILFYVQNTNTTTPKKCSTIKHDRENNLLLHFLTIEHFHSLYRLFPELNPYRLYLVAP